VLAWAEERVVDVVAGEERVALGVEGGAALHCTALHAHARTHALHTARGWAGPTGVSLRVQASLLAWTHAAGTPGGTENVVAGHVPD